MQLSQDPETMADLRKFQTLGFVDDTSHRSKVLQLFFSSESGMQKLQKTHNITSKMRNNASFQLYAPEDDETGNLSTHLKPADSCAGLATAARAHGRQQPLSHGGTRMLSRFAAFRGF